jgi:hypothetical protein
MPDNSRLVRAARPHLGSLGELVLITGDPQHDRRRRRVFHSGGNRAHFFTSLTPMVWVIGNEARHRRRVNISHLRDRNFAQMQSKDKRSHA